MNKITLLLAVFVLGLTANAQKKVYKEHGLQLRKLVINKHQRVVPKTRM